MIQHRFFFGHEEREIDSAAARRLLNGEETEAEMFAALVGCSPIEARRYEAYCVGNDCVQCRGLTTKGRRCRNTTDAGNCWQPSFRAWDWAENGEGWRCHVHEEHTGR